MLLKILYLVNKMVHKGGGVKKFQKNSPHGLCMTPPIYARSFISIKQRFLNKNDFLPIQKIWQCHLGKG